MGKRQRKRDRLNLDDLHPKVAEGLTQGATAEEAAAELDSVLPLDTVDGAALVSHMADEQKKYDRIPVFRAVLRDDTDSVWHDEPTNRLQRNVIAALDPETFRAIQAGHICLRCYEPTPTAFPDLCDLCGYPMRERQIMDVAMEFKGHEHIGPGQPISEYLAEQELRKEKAAHERRILEKAEAEAVVGRRTNIEQETKRQRQRKGRKRESLRDKQSYRDSSRRLFTQ